MEGVCVIAGRSRGDRGADCAGEKVYESAGRITTETGAAGTETGTGTQAYRQAGMRWRKPYGLELLFLFQIYVFPPRQARAPVTARLLPFLTCLPLRYGFGSFSVVFGGFGCFWVVSGVFGWFRAVFMLVRILRLFHNFR